MGQRSRNGVAIGRSGFSLIEVLIALSLTTILMGGIVSAILVASRAIDGGDGPTLATTEAEQVMNDLTADLRLAVTFDEAYRTATSVRFTVPDRNDDGLAESIDFAWSGTPGDPLIRTDGEGDPVVIAEGVEHFALSYGITVMEGTGGTTVGTNDQNLGVLMVVERPDDLKPLETTRLFLIESWGHTVTLIDDDAEHAEYEQAWSAHEVVYVPSNARHNDLGDRLRDAPIGVVSELKQLPSLIDLSEDDPGVDNTASIIIEDNGHYITRPFFAGLLPIMTETAGLMHFDKPIAGGAAGLASLPDRPGEAVLVVLDAGADGYSGVPIPARRVVLPWGDDFEHLSGDGRTIMRRAIEWAADAEADEEVSAPVFSQLEDPGLDDKDFEIKHDKWAVASIVPALPPDAISWRPTRFRFLAKQKSDPLSTLIIQVRNRQADGQPGTLVLDQTSLPESALPVEYGWVDVVLSGSDPLPPDEGVCISIGTSSGSGAALVLYEDGSGAATAANQFWWGAPGDWDTDIDRDIPCELDGSVETPGG